MTYNVLLKEQPAPDATTLDLVINQSITLGVSAMEAQKAVNRLIHLDVSTQMHAECPTLVVGPKTVWQVPIHLTFPSFGDVGCVGSLDVDVTTGTVQAGDQALHALLEQANATARRFTSPATH